MINKKCISVMVISLILLCTFQSTGFSQERKESKGVDNLLAWYQDDNRENDMFTLTEDINCTINLKLVKDYREDVAALTIDTGIYSINFDPASTRSSFIIEDENLVITGSSSAGILNIKNGFLNFNSGRLLGIGDNTVVIKSNANTNINGGEVLVSGSNSTAIKSNKITYFDGGTVCAEGENAVGADVSGFTYLFKGTISAIGNNSTALSVVNAVEVTTPSAKYTPAAMIITAEGQNAVAIKSSGNSKSIMLKNLDILAEGENSLAISSNVDMIATYSKINGDTNFLDNTLISTYFCELSDNTYERKEEYTVSYKEEIICIDGELPQIEEFQISDSNGKNRGSFAAPINWNENIGTLDTLVKSKFPIVKEAHVYYSTNSPNCDMDNLLNWLNDSERVENEVFTLTGDIFIESECEFSGNIPLVIDTNDFTIFARDILTITNKNLKIIGKGNNLGVMCIDGVGSISEIIMPNGGEIIATEGTAVVSTENLALGGIPTVSSIRLMVGARHISGANITGKVIASGSVLFVNCIISGNVIANDWGYALCDVPAGNEDKEVEIEYYLFRNLENNLVATFENEFHIDLLPISYSITVKTPSPYNSIVNISVPVVWDEDDINDINQDRVGSYKISGKIQGIDGEQPVINVDIINKDKLTILGDGEVGSPFKDVRIYFKLTTDVDIEEHKTLFELQYAKGSIEGGANIGTIAPIVGSHTGYAVSDLEYPIEGYGMIILDQKRGEYGILAEEEYCFRVRTKHSGKEFFSDELWFPEQDEDGDTGVSLPSTPESELGEGGRGGGNRQPDDTESQKSISSAQIQNLIKAGKGQNTFVIDGITIILSQEALKELGTDWFSIIAKRNSSTSFAIYFKRDDDSILNLKNAVTIHIPYTNSTDAVCKIDGKVIKNGYMNDDGYIIKTNSFGEFTMAKAKPIQFNDIHNHWAYDAINFASARGIVLGDGKGSARPDDIIWESELKKMLNSILINNNTVFDSSKNQTITRANVALMLYNAFGNKKTYHDIPFYDARGMSQQYINAISFVSEKGLMSGKKTGEFAPYDLLTRAEAVQIIKNAVRGEL